MTILKLVMPSKKGQIYGALRGCTFLAHHGQPVAFSHSKKIGFRGRSPSYDGNLGGSHKHACTCSWFVAGMTSLKWQKGALQKVFLDSAAEK